MELPPVLVLKLRAESTFTFIICNLVQLYIGGKILMGYEICCSVKFIRPPGRPCLLLASNVVMLIAQRCKNQKQCFTKRKLAN